MATAPTPNSRASLLSGLRTGGVRSASIPLSDAPHTAASGASFNIPHFASQAPASYFVDEADDFLNVPHIGVNRQIPVTAAVDGPNSTFSQQQSRGLNPHSAPFNSAYSLAMPSSAQVQAQALQMQMMQLEIMRLQAQQYQAELLAQAQIQQAQLRRGIATPPASAGPLSTGFDLRSATLRRVNQAEQLKTQLGISDDQAPLSAAVGGKFGIRAPSSGASGPESRFSEDEHYDIAPFSPSAIPNQTTVISGGTSLGASTSSNTNTSSNTPITPMSKSDSAVSWRRGGNNNSVLGGNRAVTINTSPSVKVTPPPGERVSPPASATSTKARPLPLRFSAAVSQPLPAVTIETTDSVDVADDNGDSASSAGSSGSFSSPTTPPSSSSSNDVPLSPREEAAKKLYAGLGIGRPAPVIISAPGPVVVSHRMASHPLRQPRGPPSGADELGPKNFATRIRRKAIGGLGVLMDARERREVVEAF